jgi:hypothetical protein
MRETCLYGSEGGEAKAFPTPIQSSIKQGTLNQVKDDKECKYLLEQHTTWFQNIFFEKSLKRRVFMIAERSENRIYS